MSKNKRVQDHVHKYKLVIISSRTGYKAFKCQVPGCTRFIARNLVVGEKTICWKCNNELILTMENTTLVKPTHLECRGKEILGVIAPKEFKDELDIKIDDDVELFLKVLKSGVK